MILTKSELIASLQKEVRILLHLASKIDQTALDYRPTPKAETIGFDGRPTTCGQFLVNHVIGQCAAYRMQLFLYLKACGREELNTMNLWVGVDTPAAV